MNVILVTVRETERIGVAGSHQVSESCPSPNGRSGRERQRKCELVGKGLAWGHTLGISFLLCKRKCQITWSIHPFCLYDYRADILAFPDHLILMFTHLEGVRKSPNILVIKNQKNISYLIPEGKKLITVCLQSAFKYLPKTILQTCKHMWVLNLNQCSISLIFYFYDINDASRIYDSSSLNFKWSLNFQ